MHEFRLHDWTLVVVTFAGMEALVLAVALVSLRSNERILSQWLASLEVRNIVKAFGFLDRT
jgi:hypothetical protein